MVSHACFPQEKGGPYIWLSTEQYWISAMNWFQRKPRIHYFDLRCPLSTRQYFQDKQMLRGEMGLYRHCHAYCNLMQWAYFYALYLNLVTLKVSTEYTSQFCNNYAQFSLCLEPHSSNPLLVPSVYLQISR